LIWLKERPKKSKKKRKEKDLMPLKANPRDHSPVIMISFRRNSRRE
jgi:hypothetical protein